MLFKKKSHILDSFNISYELYPSRWKSDPGELLQSGLCQVKLGSSWILGFVVAVVLLSAMWDLSSLTRDQTCTPAGKHSLNHWTTCKSPKLEGFDTVLN